MIIYPNQNYIQLNLMMFIPLKYATCQVLTDPGIPNSSQHIGEGGCQVEEWVDFSRDAHWST